MSSSQNQITNSLEFDELMKSYFETFWKMWERRVFGEKDQHADVAVDPPITVEVNQ